MNIVRAESPEQARKAAEAVKKGGVDVIEITLTVPGAIKVIADRNVPLKTTKSRSDKGGKKLLAETILMEPFSVEINFNNGRVSGASRVLTRKLSDLDGLFKDRQAYSQMLSAGNPLVYRVYEIRVPEEEGHLLSCTTVIYPGKVGDEYFFTKGHFHEKEDRAEIYTCLRGEGYLLMTTRNGKAKSVAMKPGVSVYIPPYWSHRTLNCGGEPFIFYGVWPGDAGHDYESIIQNGFPLRVHEIGSRPVIVRE